MDNILKYLENTAEKFPDKTAVDDGNQQFTYQELLNRYDIQSSRSVKRILAVYDKYKRAGGELNQDLRDNLLYYQM